MIKLRWIHDADKIIEPLQSKCLWVCKIFAKSGECKWLFTCTHKTFSLGIFSGKGSHRYWMNKSAPLLTCFRSETVISGSVTVRVALHPFTNKSAPWLRVSPSQTCFLGNKCSVSEWHKAWTKLKKKKKNNSFQIEGSKSCGESSNNRTMGREIQYSEIASQSFWKTW